LLKHGIFPHSIAPVRVTGDWDALYEELSPSLEIGRERPRLPVAAFDPVARQRQREGSQAGAATGRPAASAASASRLS